MPELKKLPVSAPTEEILEVIARDGALILTDALSQADLTALKAELIPYMEATPVGIDDFTGRSTTRTGALVARSPKTRELVMNGGAGCLVTFLVFIVFTLYAACLSSSLIISACSWSGMSMILPAPTATKPTICWMPVRPARSIHRPISPPN